MYWEKGLSRAPSGAAAMIDMATLTGANGVTLGEIRSGLVSNHEGLAELVKPSCHRAAEPTWDPPHDEDSANFNKTTAADMRNAGGRPAGTVTAGLFIGHFAQSTPWAHLDIPGLSLESDGGGIGAGAAGYGVATLVEAMSAFADRWPH